MALHDRRQRLDHRLEALSGGDQPERGEQEPLPVGAVLRGHGRCASGGPSRRIRSGSLGKDRRRTVRHDANLALRAGAAVDEQTPRSVRHHDHELGLTAHRRQYLRLTVGRLRQHRVQRHDERLQELLEQREDVVAAAAAEDPVFVLEQDDVDVESAENPAGPHVVVPNRLVDRRRHTRPLRTGGLVDDHDLLDPFDLVQSEQGRAYVCRERADSARAGWVGGNDRCAQGLPAYLSWRSPTRHRSVSAAG